MEGGHCGESEETSSPSTTSGSTATGNEGSGGSGGSGKSTAIVPASWTRTGFAALFVEEAPEVNFNDRIVATLTQPHTVLPIDPHLVEVCVKNSIECTCTPDRPVLVGAQVHGSEVIVQVPDATPERPVRVVVRLLGVRRGFEGLRFPERTREQFDSNERFLQSAYNMP